MDNNENMYNTQPNQSTGNQNYYQSGTNQTQNNGQYTQTYQQTNNTYGQNQYGQSQYNQNQYGQSYGQYNQPQGNGYPTYGMNNQEPVNNNFGMKMVFSILEIISCNLITFIMGIIACVFTVQANNLYNQNRFEEFKSKAKAASICLWVGLASFIVGIIAIIGIAVIGGSADDGGSTSSYGAGTSVTVDGTYIAIPLEFSELEAMGFQLDDYSVGTEVAAGDIDFIAVDNKYGEDVMWAWIENNHSYEADATECTVIGIDVDYDCDNYETFVSEDGVTFDCSKSDLIDLLGDPDEEDVDYDDRELWRWYIGSGKNSWQVIEITFEEGDVIFDIDIDYRK